MVGQIQQTDQLFGPYGRKNIGPGAGHNRLVKMREVPAEIRHTVSTVTN
jgi:hypothetical protein